jgi:hypothetical protein
VLRLDEPHRIEIDDGHDGAEIAGPSGDALTIVGARLVDVRHRAPRLS